PDLERIERRARALVESEGAAGALEEAMAEFDATVDAPPTRTNGRGKPEWLMRSLVRDYSDFGERICDPFAGYGSTLAAARFMGRTAIGSEMDIAIARAASDQDLRVGR